MDTRKILILGYYFRSNLGDDVFEHVLTNYFQQKWDKSEYIFMCIDDLKEVEKDISCVIVGGGDLVNDYFFNKLKPFLSNKTCPWYAISIGIPYPSLIEKGYLDRFDYIIHRNQEDIKLLSDKYPGRTQWSPDLSFLLPHYHKNNKEIKYNNTFLSHSKKIGIFLSRHIYCQDKPSDYDKIVINLSKFLSEVSLLTNIFKKPIYELYLIPFCTDGKIGSDDRKINKDVFDKIKDYGDLNNVHLIDRELYIHEIIPTFNSFHMTICTRFHAHMFSLMSKVPILSIYTTRKVENLLEEIGAKDFSYQMETNSKGYPIFLDNKLLMQKFLKLELEYNSYSLKLQISRNLYTTQIKNFVTVLDNLLFYLPRYLLPDEIHKKANEISISLAKKFIHVKKDLLGLDMIDNRSVYDMLSRIDNKLVKVTQSRNRKSSRRNINDQLNKLIHNNGYIKTYFRRFDKKVRENIIDLISYCLTGERKSEYHYGLEQQVFTDSYNLLESCKWILDHRLKSTQLNEFKYLLKNTYQLSDRKLNLNYINSNIFSGYHRSGWSYVLDSMKKIHNPEGVIFDSYLDKTFGWEHDFLSLAQIIPYRKPWIGVFHHTSNEDYSDNNLINVFSKSNFIESLKTCKGIIVFSENNRKWLLSKTNVPILVLTHPTELVSDNSLFNYQLFKMNPIKKVIQIGAWLRNSYAIYELNVPEKYYKFALKGKDMGNYFISDNDINEISNNIKLLGYNKKDRISSCPFSNDRISGQPVKNTEANKYAVGLSNLVIKNHKSVNILNNLSNEQYDELLSNNIVFINLVDAAAVNTIIECIVRNTPIIVNRLPATEEYLGEDYPLLYDNIHEVASLLTDKNIRNAYNYISKMDKNKFCIDFFLDSLTKSKIYQELFF